MKLFNEQPTTSNQQTVYDVFISHAAEDTGWCERLAGHLRHAGLRVWLDKWKERENLFEAMEEGLEQSRRAVLVLTPKYSRSQKIWTAVERQFIDYQQRLGRREFVIPLLLKDCAPPPFLQPLKGLDFRNNSAHDANLRQLIAMLKAAPQDDAALTLADVADFVPAPGQLPPNSHLPYEWNPYFAGRDGELEKLHHLLNPGENSAAENPVAAIAGVAGIGKTQLAIEYAFRYGRHYTGGVYWTSAVQSENLHFTLGALADPMGLNLPMNLPDRIRAEHVLAWLCQPEPRLLILDDVEDPAVLAQCAVEGGGCRVLITTRRTDLQPAEQLPIGTLDKEAALALLISRRPELQLTAGSLEKTIGKSICDRLGYLPLALELAACYLGRHKQMSLADYLAELESVAARNNISLPGAGQRKSRAGYRRAAAVAFQMNFRELAKAPGAEPLILAACQFASQPINPILLGKVANFSLANHEGEKALELLGDLSLCKPVENGRLQMHWLLAHLGQKLTPRKEVPILRERLIVTMLDFMKTTNEVTRLNAVESELPHVIKAAEMAVSQKTWPWDFELCSQIGKYFKERGDDVACLLWWQRAKQICEAHQPLAEEFLVTTLNNVGFVLQAQGDWTGALAQYRQALAIRKKALGEEHPDVAESLNNIGELLRAQGNWAGALALHQRALTIRKKALGEDHPEVAVSLINLGDILRLQGDFAGAVTHHQQALGIWKKGYGEKHPYVITSLDSIAAVLEAQGDWASALSYREQALAIRRKVLGGKHPDVATSLNNIGLVLHAQENRAKAADNLRRALAILEEILGPEHPDTQTVRENLAIVERGKGRVGERVSG
jgi:tetratricopeptide (TPR) repeat protein